MLAIDAKIVTVPRKPFFFIHNMLIQIKCSILELTLWEAHPTPPRMAGRTVLREAALRFCDRIVTSGASTAGQKDRHGIG